MFLRRLGTRLPAARPCFKTFACPDIFELTDGDFAVIGRDITDTATLLPPDAGCAPNERIVRIPRQLLVSAKTDIPDTV